MRYALSTLMFKSEDLAKSFDFARELGLTLEIFPCWHEEAFVQFMKKHLADLRGLVCSFHEPYLFCEHTAPRGSKEYTDAVEACKTTLEYAADLGAEHIAFHHNNRSFSPAEKADMIKYSMENLQEMNEIAAGYGIPYLVENAGVISRNNMLFNEEEFINLFDSIENDCLLDIGHAHGNSWDIAGVITALGSRIKAYHIHSNDGFNDSHLPMNKGTLDMTAVKPLFNTLTPGAHIVFEYEKGTDISIDELRADVDSMKV